MTDIKIKPDDPTTWRQSGLLDDEGNTQIVFRCPTCGVVVGDPYVHLAWHKNMRGFV